jgi:hypothetical protein
MRMNEKVRLDVISSVAIALMALGGCHRASSPAAAQASSAPAGVPGSTDAAKRASGKDEQGQAASEVVLTSEQMNKIGLQTEVATTAHFGEEVAGYGTVIPHESIAQGVAELVTAEAVEKESQAALMRVKRLSGTAGALSADTEESNARQAAVDSAALLLAKQRLSGTFGQKPPWASSDNRSILTALASGGTQLVRVTFPLGTLPGAVPSSLQVAHIGASGDSKRLKLTAVWAAPADPTVPGRSFFALLSGNEFGEGERVLVRAPVGVTTPGIVVSQDAVLISDNKYWCFVEKKPGTFLRTEIDASKPMESGYFVTANVEAGDKVVIHGAAQLLAQESKVAAGDTE